MGTQINLKYSPRSEKIDVFLSEMPEKPQESWIKRNLSNVMTPIFMFLLFGAGMGWFEQTFMNLLWWVLGILQTIGFLMCGIMVAATSYTAHTVRTLVEGDKLFMSHGIQTKPSFDLTKYKLRVADINNLNKSRITLWRFLFLSLPYWALLCWNGWIVIAIMSMATLGLIHIAMWQFRDLVKMILQQVDPDWNGEIEA
jgi:hypothetical protein